MFSSRTLVLFFALAGAAFADTAYVDFNAAITTFNSQVNLWNSGPLGLPAFNADIQTFDSAVDSFNLETGQTYADVGVLAAYGNIGFYPGESAPIAAFNNAAATFNTSVASFQSGSLDRPDFASAVTIFNSAVSTFNASGANPPVSFALAPPTYSQQQFVTEPDAPTPEPSSALVMILGLGLGAVVRKNTLSRSPSGANSIS